MSTDATHRLTLNLAEAFQQLIDDRVASALDERTAAVDLVTGKKGYLNAIEAAEYLACKKSRIYDLVQIGALESYRDGARLLFRREDLDAYVESGGVSLPTAATRSKSRARDGATVEQLRQRRRAAA